MKLSITTAWNETVAFVKHEAGPLFLIMFALAVLPGLILQTVAQRFIGPAMTVAPGTPPDFATLRSALPVFFLLLIPVLLLSLWGHLTVNTLALRRERVIGSAFGHAARRILPLIGVWLIWILGVALVFGPVAVLMFSSAKSGHWGLPALLFLIIWLLLVFVAVRLLLTTPVAAAEPVGPVGIIRRSWQLTSGQFWRLFGFLVLILIVFFVFAIVVGAVAGVIVTLLAGRPTPGSISSFIIQLITGVLQAIFLTFFVVMIARIYAQLSGSDASVGQVFE
jgi:hypothetical protein